jgi:DnaJ like chaperone protein
MLLFVIIGGLIGLLVGGGIGLLVGALAGLALGEFVLRVIQPVGQGGVQEQFLDATFAVMGALCKADGVVTPDEIRVGERYFDKLALSPDQRRAAIAAFDRGKCVGFDLYGTARKLRWTLRYNRALLLLFLQIQFSAVTADGVLHENERRKLLHVTHALGLKDVDLESLEAMLGNQRSGIVGSSLNAAQCAYTALGVKPSASDAEVKRAYRRLMSQYHPDKFASRGLCENMREIALERVHEVRRAYDTIKEARGGRL